MGSSRFSSDAGISGSLSSGFKWGTVALLALGTWLSGCNFFAPLAADNRGDLTYRGLILKGNQAINDGDYASAESYFKQAQDLNHRGSEGYLFHAKALAGSYGLDYQNLNAEFEAHRSTAAHSAEKGVPFVDSTTTLAGIDSVYYPVATAVQDLEHILRKAADTVRFNGPWMLLPDGDTASDGRVTEGVARLDLGLLQAVKALLAPLDLDGNNHIDAECGLNLCGDLHDAICTGSARYLAKCSEGPASELNRFENFKKLTKRIDLENLDTKDVNARNVSTNPNDINAFLDAMQAPIAASSYNLDSVTGAMNSHNQQALSGQLTSIVGNITDLNSFLGYMRFNNGADNDFDAQDTSKAAKLMIWYDYDKDNGIRFNYDDPQFEGLEDGGNIGHPIHRYVYGKSLYLSMAEYKLRFPVAAADKDSNGVYNKNSRIALMIKHCDDIVAKMETSANPQMKSMWQRIATAHTCDSITSVLRPGVVPKPRSDWLGGTPGVDEEEIDEHDNDYDGLKDEDARNAKGLDDDDDAILTVSMIGKVPPPMVWNDVPDHVNKCSADGSKVCACPDIDVTVPLKPFPNQRENCIGSIENRIYMAGHGGDTALASHYSYFVGEAANANCLDDFLKLPVEYRAQFGEGATTSADQIKQNSPVRLGCHYKHIWIAGMPPHSEWTAGTFGIDEEKPDAVDNDGDGWIDEDIQ